MPLVNAARSATACTRAAATAMMATSSFALVARPRAVESVVKGRATTDGAGVALTRLLSPVSSPAGGRLDPFLMLDSFSSSNPEDYIAGFPNHPHRGQETLTLMFQGKLRHADNRGNAGVVRAGGAQFMCAGSGVIHSEVPAQAGGALEGVQLWINMPAALKMATPAFYRDVRDEAMPRLAAVPPGVTARVVLGAPPGPSTPPVQPDPALVRPGTAALVVDVAWQGGSGGEVAIPLPPGHNAAVFVVGGAVAVGGEVGRAVVSDKTMAVLETAPDADGVLLASTSGPARALVLAGAPLGEAVVAGGPFVMDTEEGVGRAWADFHAGGFGGAPPSPPRE